MKVKCCEFNMDTARVEVFFDDGTLISINCPDVEDEVAHTPVQRGELDWLIYNEPLTYAQLVLSGEINTYLKGKPEHILQN